MIIKNVLGKCEVAIMKNGLESTRSVQARDNSSFFIGGIYNVRFHGFTIYSVLFSLCKDTRAVTTKNRQCTVYPGPSTTIHQVPVAYIMVRIIQLRGFVSR